MRGEMVQIERIGKTLDELKWYLDMTCVGLLDMILLLIVPLIRAQSECSHRIEALYRLRPPLCFSSLHNVRVLR